MNHRGLRAAKSGISSDSQIPLGDVTIEITERNASREYTEVRSVTNSQGLVRTSDFFDNSRTSADTKNYKVVQQGMFVYNPSRINVGSIGWLMESAPVIVSPMYVVFKLDPTRILPAYLQFLFDSGPGRRQIENKTEVGARFRLPYKALSRIQFPIPPLDVQRETVKSLNLFKDLEAALKEELEARKLQSAFYRDRLLAAHKEIVSLWTTMGEIAVNLDSKRKPVTKSARELGSYPYYGASGIVDYVDDYIFDGDYLLVSEDGANLLARSTPIAFSVSGKSWVNNHAHVLSFSTYAERRFAEIYLNSIDLSPFVTGGAQPKLNQANLNRIPIPWPSRNEQERFVAIMDKFDALVNDVSVGLPAELVARRKQYEYYRDRLLTFEEKVA